jgi:YVTN family beta-propeller protein
VIANNNPDLLVFNANTLELNQVIPIDPNPGGAQYEISSSSHIIYFPARGSYALELIGQANGTTYSEVPTPTAYAPTTTFLDPTNGLVYMMLGGLLDDPGNHISIFNPVTGTFVSNLTLGKWPNSYAYDSARHLLYVTCVASEEVSVINTQTDTVAGTIHFPSDTQPQGIAVDPVTGHLFVSLLGTDQVVEFGLTAPPASPTPSDG